MRLLSGLIVLALLLTPAAADQPSDFDIRYKVELPAHRALERARADGGGTPGKFTSDGCSGGLSLAWMIVSDQFPEFSKAHGMQPPWENCCVIHDSAYHGAGASPIPEKSFENRAKADQALRECVVHNKTEKLHYLREASVSFNFTVK